MHLIGGSGLQIEGQLNVQFLRRHIKHVGGLTQKWKRFCMSFHHFLFIPLGKAALCLSNASSGFEAPRSEKCLKQFHGTPPDSSAPFDHPKKRKTCFALAVLYFSCSHEHVVLPCVCILRPFALRVQLTRSLAHINSNQETCRFFALSLEPNDPCPKPLSHDLDPTA